MTDKLKPCPFCGGDAVLYNQSSKYTDRNSYLVNCSNCSCRTREFAYYEIKARRETEQKAIEAWNRRVDNDR
jgi:Lar family restriction alleviation protein